jgi:hypothetical protein
MEKLTMRELIERSSLGSPEAVAMCARTPRWVRDMLVERVMAALAADAVAAS